MLYYAHRFLSRFRDSETRNTRPPQHSMCVAAPVAPQGNRGSGEGLLPRYLCQIRWISSQPNSFHSPAVSPPPSNRPIATRTNLKVG